MTRKGLGLLSILLVLAMLAAACATGLVLPGEMRLPIHWGIDGQADGFAGKWTALLLPPVLAAGVSLLFYFLPALEPRREGLERSQGLYLWGWAAILLMSIAVDLAVLSAALGWDIPVNHLVIGSMGVMLVLIGNQLGKSRSMYMIGIRTPWTLASEEVWIKTHRLGGKLTVLAGLVMALTALLPVSAGLLAVVMIAAITVAAIVPMIYSFILWRHEQGANR